MDYQHGKAKPLGMFSNKFGTRKNWRCKKGNVILPRSNGEWWWQNESSRSRRRKWLEKLSNRKVRKYIDIPSGMAYKKVYNLKRELD